jgi:hypothetical protein
MTAPAPIVAIDIETDGLHPGRRVWEVAMIRRDYDQPDEDGRSRWTETTFHTFVGIDLKNSDPKGLQVGGFWDRHPAGRKLSSKPPCPTDLGNGVMSKHDAASTVMRMTFGAHVVGVNPAFDADTLSGLLRAEGYIASWHYHLVDMVAMSVGYLAGRPQKVVLGVDLGTDRGSVVAMEASSGHMWTLPKEGPWVGRTPIGPPWKSDELSRACGVEPPGGDRHTALADAKWALRWYDAITGGAQ